MGKGQTIFELRFSIDEFEVRCLRIDEYLPNVVFSSFGNDSAEFGKTLLHHASISFSKSSMDTSFPAFASALPFWALSMTYSRYMMSSISAESGSFDMTLIASCFRLSIVNAPVVISEFVWLLLFFSTKRMGDAGNTSQTSFTIMPLFSFNHVTRNSLVRRGSDDIVPKRIPNQIIDIVPARPAVWNRYCIGVHPMDDFY